MISPPRSALRPRAGRRAVGLAIVAAGVGLLAGCASIPGLNAFFLSDAPDARQDGAAAPGFDLPAARGEAVSLDALLRDGRSAVIVFYRAAW